MKFTLNVYQKIHMTILLVFGFIFMTSNIIIINVVDLNIEGGIGSFLVLSFIVLLITLFVAVIMTKNIDRHLNKPIEKLKDTMKESLLSGQIVPFVGDTNEETRPLIEGYNEMATHINEQNAKFKVVTRELLESDRKLREEYLNIIKIAYSDYQTGLPNRAKFEEVALQKIDDRQRFAYLFLDLDNIKEINNKYGHNLGNKIIGIISKRIDSCCTEGNFFARLNSDEFGLLVPIKVIKTEVKERAKSILHEISKPIKLLDKEFIISGSIGISVFPDDGETMKQIMANVDVAMIRGKAEAKSHVFTYNSKLDPKAYIDKEDEN